jgi:ArsR family transcriptional regulator
VNDKGYRDPERYRLHAEVCRVLTDPKRLMLLDVLREGEHSVGDLAGELGCNLANASQHLAVLRSAGLVETRRVGTTVLYTLAEPELVEACDVIHQIVGRRIASRSARVAASAVTPAVDEIRPVASGVR